MPLPQGMRRKYDRWMLQQPDWKMQTFSLLTRRWSIGVAHYLLETWPHEKYTVEVAKLASATGLSPLLSDAEWTEAFKQADGAAVSLPLSLVAVDEANVATVAPYMDEPIFLAQMDGQAVFPIDGYHRIYRACYVEKRETLFCYVLDEREEQLCRLA